jgi:hypothetical protein
MPTDRIASEREALAEKLYRAFWESVGANDSSWEECKVRKDWLRVADAALAATGRDRLEARSFVRGVLHRYYENQQIPTDLLADEVVTYFLDPEPAEAERDPVAELAEALRDRFRGEMWSWDEIAAFVSERQQGVESGVGERPRAVEQCESAAHEGGDANPSPRREPTRPTSALYPARNCGSKP